MGLGCTRYVCVGVGRLFLDSVADNYSKNLCHAATNAMLMNQVKAIQTQIQPTDIQPHVK